MKRSILSFSLIFVLILSAVSQERQHIIKIFPAGFINKFKISYENPFHEDITWGGLFSFYYGGSNNDFKGIKTEPAIRFYTGKTPGLGLYLQLKAGGGYFFQDQIIYIDERIYNPSGEYIRLKMYERERELNFATYGGGLAIGVQFALDNKKNFLMNIELGVQCYKKYKEYRNEYTYTDEDGCIHKVTETENSPFPTMLESDWYLDGPGAILNPSLSFGYRF